MSDTGGGPGEERGADWAFCQGKTSDGQPCRWSVKAGVQFCHHHNPDRKRKRKRKPRTGAAVPLPGPPPETVEDAVRWASWAVTAMATGKLDPRTGREIGSLLRALAEARKHVDRTDARMKALQDKLKTLQDAKRGR